MRLPTTPEQVTATWLTAALQQRVPAAEVLACRLYDTMTGTATKLKVAVTLNDAAKAAGVPPSLVVKGRFRSDIQITEGLYQAEVMIYRDLAAELGLNVPRCLFAGSDPINAQHIVVLEDLACRDVTFCRVENPLTYPQAASFLDNVARLHAAFWNSPEFEAGGMLEQVYFWDCV